MAFDITRLFVQRLIQDSNKENTKALAGPLLAESTGYRWFPFINRYMGNLLPCRESIISHLYAYCLPCFDDVVSAVRVSTQMGIAYIINNQYTHMIALNMMTSSNGTIFPRYWSFVREITGHRWIPP